MVACLAVALALFLIGQIQVNNKEKEKADIEKKLEDNRYLKQLKDMHQTSMDTLNRVIVYDDIEKDYNVAFEAFLEELEEKMPSNFVSSIIIATNEDIRMVVSCKTKEDLATIAQELYNFDTVTITKMDTVVESVYVEPVEELPEGVSPTPTPEEPSPTPSITEPPELVVTCEIFMVYRALATDALDSIMQGGEQ